MMALLIGFHVAWLLTSIGWVWLWRRGIPEAPRWMAWTWPLSVYATALVLVVRT